jgi:hypothetical protein
MRKVITSADLTHSSERCHANDEIVAITSADLSAITSAGPWHRDDRDKICIVEAWRAPSPVRQSRPCSTCTPRLAASRSAALDLSTPISRPRPVPKAQMRTCSPSNRSRSHRASAPAGFRRARRHPFGRRMGTSRRAPEPGFRSALASEARRGSRQVSVSPVQRDSCAAACRTRTLTQSSAPTSLERTRALRDWLDARTRERKAERAAQKTRFPRLSSKNRRLLFGTGATKTSLASAVAPRSSTSCTSSRALAVAALSSRPRSNASTPAGAAAKCSCRAPRTQQPHKRREVPAECSVRGAAAKKLRGRGGAGLGAA